MRPSGPSPVGTGPFRFVRWERGKEIVLAANPEYFDGPPKLSRLVFRIFAGERLDRVFAEFQAGALEDTPIPSKDYRQIIASQAYQHVRRPMFNLRHYGISTRMKPLDDRRVRQAIVYAIDREAIVEEVLLGRYALARGILPPGTLGYNPKLKGYPHDPGTARELLAQAGYPGGRGLPPVTIWSSVRPRDPPGARADPQGPRGRGRRAEFQYITDWPSFSRHMAERKLPVFLRAWFADVPDPENFLFQAVPLPEPAELHGVREPGGRRASRAGPGASRTSARRVELYRRAEEMIMEDAPVIPVWHYTYERLFQPYVKGVEVSGLGDSYIPLRKMWLERPR